MNPLDDSSQEDELARAIASYVELQRAGNAPSSDDFARNYPRVEAALRACLDVLTRIPSIAPTPLEVPRELGDFRLLEVIGRGGMGVVYRAEQVSLRRRVALKVLAPSVDGEAQRRTRFRREIEVTANLRHASIVPVLEAGEVNGLPYYAMPLLDGESLDRAIARMREGATPSPLANRHELVAWIARFIEVSRALDLAHRAGVIHRDIKPSNLFLEASGRLVVLDFGLTRSSAYGTSLTGQPVGTPRYMSPEQVLVHKFEIDGLSDQFSLAATLYELLVLVPAFAGDDRERVFHAILSVDPRAPRSIDSRVPRDLEVVLLRALEKEPSRRYASCTEFADDLQRFLDYEPVRTRPVGALARVARRARRHPVTAAAIAVAALAVVAVPIGVGVEARERTRVSVERELEAARAARTQLARCNERIRASDKDLRDSRQASEPWTAVQQERMTTVHATAAKARRDRDQAFQDALTHLTGALGIAPGHAVARRELAHVAFDEYREAEQRHDRDRMEALRPLVLAYDGGELANAWKGMGAIAIVSDPPGAEVFLFRFESKGALRVAVPVMPDGTTDATWLAQVDERGPWSALRVLSVDRRGLLMQPGDELFNVCGDPILDAEMLVQHLAIPHEDHERSHVVDMRRGARLGSGLVPPNTVAKIEGELTAHSPFPLRCAPSDTWARTPIEQELDCGSYLAVLRSDGFEVRAPFEIRASDEQRIDVSFAEATLLGDEFAYVPAGRALLGADPRAIDGFDAFDAVLPAFFIQRREVTFREYFAYIDALDELNPAEAEQRAPRHWRIGTEIVGAMWRRDAGGLRPALPDGFDLDRPIVGVSFSDAAAYCVWRNQTSGRDDIEFALPREEEWEKAARGVDGRTFAWGDALNWTFARLGLTAALVGLARGGAYPTDESVYGVRDMNGNVREWCDARLASDNRRILRGGCWMTAVEAETHLASRGETHEVEYVDICSGFRMVARPLR